MEIYQKKYGNRREHAILRIQQRSVTAESVSVLPVPAFISTRSNRPALSPTARIYRNDLRYERRAQLARLRRGINGTDRGRSETP